MLCLMRKSQVLEMVWRWVLMSHLFLGWWTNLTNQLLLVIIRMPRESMKKRRRRQAIHILKHHYQEKVKERDSFTIQDEYNVHLEIGGWTTSCHNKKWNGPMWPTLKIHWVCSRLCNLRMQASGRRPCKKIMTTSWKMNSESWLLFLGAARALGASGCFTLKRMLWKIFCATRQDWWLEVFYKLRKWTSMIPLLLWPSLTSSGASLHLERHWIWKSIKWMSRQLFCIKIWSKTSTQAKLKVLKSRVWSI